MKVKNRVTEISAGVRGVIKIDKKKLAAGIVVVIASFAAIAAIVFNPPGIKTAGQEAGEINTAQVLKLDLTEELASVGILKPKNTYNVTSLAEGEIIEAGFEEGDQVEKGQILYNMDVSSIKSEVDSAAGSLQRAEKSYENAQNDYQAAAGKYAGNLYHASETGYIKTLYVKEGEKAGPGTKIADLYDDRIMQLKLPYISAEAAAIAPGSAAVVTLASSGEQLQGTVTAVSGKDEVLTGGRLVRYVTIQVANPGGLTGSLSATATVGEIICSMEGTFSPVSETVLVADLSDTVTIEKLLVSEGDYVGGKSAVFRMDGQSAEKILRSFQEASDRALETVEGAKNKLESTQNSLENYTITAPISGTVIKKNGKAGDKISKAGDSSPLAVIYDLSTITFSMSIDELDVKKVKVGQKVEISADAVDDQMYYGTVQNVSLESSNNNGVSTYPVTVVVEQADGLLPGMNVSGKILLKEAGGVLGIPVDALMRGNIVYVKDDSVKQSVGEVPAGFKEVTVETGITTMFYVEVLSGLKEGDVVYRSMQSVPGDDGGDTPQPDVLEGDF